MWGLGSFYMGDILAAREARVKTGYGRGRRGRHGECLCYTGRVLRSVLLSLLPGVAQVDRGRCLRGLAFFIPFAALANAALIAPLLSSDLRLRLGAALAAAGIWILSLVDACRLARRAAAASPKDPGSDSAPPPGPGPAAGGR